MKNFIKFLKENSPEITPGKTSNEKATGMGSAMVYSAPPSQKPAYRKPSQSAPGSGAPQDPGEAPKRGPDESAEAYARRYKEWLLRKRMWDAYQSIDFPYGTIYSYPRPFPMKKDKDHLGRPFYIAVPPAKEGDVYIGPDGTVWQCDGFEWHPRIQPLGSPQV